MEGKNGEARDFNTRIMEERDKINPSPSVRATAVWNILNSHNPRPTLWDIVCFSTEALTISAAESYPFLAKIVRALVTNVYAIHYHGDELINSFVDKDGKFEKT